MTRDIGSRVLRVFDARRQRSATVPDNSLRREHSLFGEPTRMISGLEKAIQTNPRVDTTLYEAVGMRHLLISFSGPRAYGDGISRGSYCVPLEKLG